MTLVSSTRLTAYLNAVLHRRVAAPVAIAGVLGDDVAHHVVDPGSVLGLDPLAATDLRDAWPVITAAEPERWVLALPLPGRLGALRGPATVNRAALEAGSAVVAAGGRVALVPHVVGRAVQWQVFSAEPPLSPASPAEAERGLSETVITAADTLARLDVAAGPRPDGDVLVQLAPGYGHRQQATAQRAARLLLASGTALQSAGGVLSSYEVQARDRELRAVRDAALEALCSAATWLRG